MKFYGMAGHNPVTKHP